MPWSTPSLAGVSVNRSGLRPDTTPTGRVEMAVRRGIRDPRREVHRPPEHVAVTDDQRTAGHPGVARGQARDWQGSEQVERTIGCRIGVVKADEDAVTEQLDDPAAVGSHRFDSQLAEPHRDRGRCLVAAFLGQSGEGGQVDEGNGRWQLQAWRDEARGLQDMLRLHDAVFVDGAAQVAACQPFPELPVFRANFAHGRSIRSKTSSVGSPWRSSPSRSVASP